MVVPLYDIMNDLNTGSKEGEVELNRAMSVGELRKAIEADTVNPNTLQNGDFREMIEALSTGYGNVLVTVYDEDERHFGLVDRNEKRMDSMTLSHISQYGYKVIETGVRDYEYKDGNSYQHAWAEFRPIEDKK